MNVTNGRLVQQVHGKKNENIPMQVHTNLKRKKKLVCKFGYVLRDHILIIILYLAYDCPFTMILLDLDVRGYPSYHKQGSSITCARIHGEEIQVKAH